jgi:hypothetical protein
MISRKNDERGQAFVLTAVFLVMLCGMCALVLDVGSWYRQKRQLQGTADAAALAGAQVLPNSWGTAKSLALEYADKNGGGVLGGDVTSGTTFINGDTISVTAKTNSPGVFSRVLGITTVTVSAHASAMRGSFTGWALGLAPWVIDKPSVKFQEILTFKVEAGDQAAPGNFGGVDLPVKEKGCAFGSGGNDYYDLIARRTTSCLVKVNQNNVPVEPGNKAATGTAVKDRGAKKPFDPYSILITDTNGNTQLTDYNSPNLIVIPVVKAFNNGSSQPFTIIGFAWFIITDYTAKTVTGMFVRSGAPSSAVCPTASDPNAACPFGAYDPDGFATVKLIQ